MRGALAFCLLLFSIDCSAAAVIPTTAPAPAANAGYTVKTFDSSQLGSTAGTWINFNFYANSGVNHVTQNGDGSITISGDTSNGYNASLSTAAQTIGTAWKGMSFGNGGYFEATFSIIGAPIITALPTAAFWADDIETMSGQSAQTSGNQWIEIDAIEANQASSVKYGQSIHNWYNTGGSNTTVNCSVGSPAILPNSGLQASNQVAFLWVPATVSTQGYVKFYFNRIQVGSTCTWNLYSGIFPPSGASIGSVLDTRHLAMILGNSSGSGVSMNITKIEVWQKSSAGNLIN